MKDDMISRQAALDALGERPVVWSDNDDYTLGARNQYDMDRLALETVPSAQQWIPCSERMPEEEKDVLACTESGELLVAYVFNDWGNRWVWTTGALGSGSVDVVAWMPLPEPYREEVSDRWMI